MFLGIDPGIVNIGLCAIRYDGHVLMRAVIKDDSKVRAGRLDPARLAAMTRRTQMAINAANLGRNIVCAIEEPFQFRGKKGGNSNSLKTYGVYTQLSQVFWHRVEERTARELIIVPPTSLKSFIGCKGDRSKEAVAALVKKRWGFTDKSNDIIDAYALARWAKQNFRRSDGRAVEGVRP